MAALTLTFVLNTLTSQRLVQAVARASFFGACSALRSACVNLESMSRTIRNLDERYPERAAALRSSPKFKELDQKCDAAANKAAGVHAIAESVGIMLHVDFAPPLPTATTQADAVRISTLTGMDVGKIMAIRSASSEKKYREECESEDMAAGLFWGASAPVNDVLVKYDSVVKAIEKTQLYLLGWSVPDFAELGLIHADDAEVATWETRFPDDRLPEDYVDDEERLSKEMRSEVEQLDKFAKQQETLRYLDAERAKAAKKAKSHRVKKGDLAKELAQ